MAASTIAGFSGFPIIGTEVYFRNEKQTLAGNPAFGNRVAHRLLVAVGLRRVDHGVEGRKNAPVPDRIEKTRDYTVMPNHHLRNTAM